MEGMECVSGGPEVGGTYWVNVVPSMEGMECVNGGPKVGGTHLVNVVP